VRSAAELAVAWAVAVSSAGALTAAALWAVAWAVAVSSAGAVVAPAALDVAWALALPRSTGTAVGATTAAGAGPTHSGHLGLGFRCGCAGPLRGGPGICGYMLTQWTCCVTIVTVAAPQPENCIPPGTAAVAPVKSTVATVPPKIVFRVAPEATGAAVLP